jgi:hypothetical protein
MDSGLDVAARSVACEGEFHWQNLAVFAQVSKRANRPCRYCSTQADRLTLPLVVIGTEPGGTRTRSATTTARPCQPAGGPIKICSGRIGDKVFITVVATKTAARTPRPTCVSSAPGVVDHSWGLGYMLGRAGAPDRLLSCDELVRPH